MFIFKNPETIPVSLYPIKLTGRSDQKEEFLNKIDHFTKIHHSDRILDIEFFEVSNNLYINVLDIVNNIVFKKMIIDTAKTLHIIIKMDDWPAGPYTIVLKNDTGILIFGNIILQ